jgi:phosphoribosyl 1,2-cyclic phosphodiesterase
MLRVTVLGSGSRGNAILVDGTEGTLLIDAGFSARSLAKRLLAADRRAEQLTSLVLTHEHTDHACGAAAVCAKWKLPLHATAGTIAALRESADGVTAQATPLSATHATHVDGFDVRAIPVPHDARECAALVITDRRSGARVGVALDLGHVPLGLPDAFAKLDLLVVESNHDEQLLANGPYPWSLKQRIGGELGHLSNRAAAAFGAACAHRGLRGVLLAHLSETNNTPAHAMVSMRDAMRRAGWRSDALWAAHQRDACGPVGLQGITTASTPVQLSFGL